MNYCRKCQSDYEKPGTCNCFATTPTAHTSPQPELVSYTIYNGTADIGLFRRAVVDAYSDARARGILRT